MTGINSHRITARPQGRFLDAAVTGDEDHMGIQRLFNETAFGHLLFGLHPMQSPSGKAAEDNQHQNGSHFHPGTGRKGQRAGRQRRLDIAGHRFVQYPVVKVMQLDGL